MKRSPLRLVVAGRFYYGPEGGRLTHLRKVVYELSCGHEIERRGSRVSKAVRMRCKGCDVP